MEPDVQKPTDMHDAFISYSRQDKEFASKLKKALEDYKPPKDLNVPQQNLNIFRDESDFTGVEYNQSVKRHLKDSARLIVLCSPHARKSPYVNEEIRLFTQANGVNSIIPILLSGIPNNEVTSGQEADMAFPEALCEVMELPLATDYRDFDLQKDKLNKAGFESSWYALLANIYDVSRSEIEQRNKKRQARKRNLTIGIIGGIAAILLVAFIVTLISYFESERQRRIALARQLAAQAIANADSQFDLALLLSLEANRLTDSAEVRGSLLTVLEASPHLITFLRGHAHSVESVAFNLARHSNMLASVGIDGTVLLWDTGTHQRIGPLNIGNRIVLSIAFSLDGRILALGTTDGTILLWDMAAHQLLGELLTDHQDPVGNVAFSPDGTLVAAGYAGGVVMLWDVVSRQPHCRPLTGHQREVTRVAFSPDGTRVASGSRDNGMIILWDVAQCQQRGPHLYGHHGTTIAGLTFNPASTLVASSGKDDTIMLWDVATGQPHASLRGHRNWVFSVAFSPDGTKLASGSWDNTVIVWDVATGQPLAPPLRGHTAPVLSVAFSSDGNTVASGGRDTAIILWHVTAPDVLTIPSARLGRPVPWEVVAWQRYGRSLTDYSGFVTSVTFSPDGRTLAAGTGDHTVMLWDVATQQPLDPPFTRHETTVWAVAFSPDGRTVASGSADGTIFLWDMATRQPLSLPLTPPLDFGTPGLIREITFSPDGHTLAASSRDASFILWDVATRQPRCQAQRPDGRTSYIAFHRAGDVMAAGSDHGPITVWKTNTCQRLAPPLTGHTQFVRKVVFSPDGQRLISSSDDQTIRLWDVATGQQLGPRMIGHTNWVHGLALSPDGHLLASSDHDGQVMLWEMASRRPLGRPLMRHSNWVRSIAFSPDSHLVASGGGDGKIILWNVDFASSQAQGCQKANRNLSHEEWAWFVGDQPYRLTCSDHTKLQ